MGHMKHYDYWCHLQQNKIYVVVQWVYRVEYTTVVEFDKLVDCMTCSFVIP